MSAALSKTRIISCVSATSFQELRRSLKTDGYHLFELEGEAISDKESLFREITKKLPLDPPLVRGGNWDALVDSFWGGLDKLQESKVAIVWRDSERIVEESLCDLLTCIDCFTQVARSVATKQYGVSKPIDLLVFLVGTGASYKPFGV